MAVKTLIVIALAVATALPAGKSSASTPPEPVDVLTAGKDSVSGVPDALSRYAQYREQTVVVTNSGRVVMIAQGRNKSRWSDRSGQDLVCKTSTDAGGTWSPGRLVVSHGLKSICPNAAVYDKQTGRIHVLYNLFMWDFTSPPKDVKGELGDMNCRQFTVTSDDEGRTWSKPRDISEMVGTKGAVMVVGSGEGIQLTHGPRKGRLIVAGGDFYKGKKILCYYSDDAGKTWKRSKVVPTKGDVSWASESKVAELPNGVLVLHSRTFIRNGSKQRLRTRSFSTDGGTTWSRLENDPALKTVSCNGSLIAVKHSRGSDGAILLCSAPVGPGRTHGAVYASLDGGKTWPVRKLAVPGGFAYSSLLRMPDGKIGLFYETDKYRKISVVKFSTDWLFKNASPAKSNAESFEKTASGPLTKLATTVGVWRGESGHAEITRHTARSGRQALRIFGGRERIVEFTPTADEKDRRILRFWAERWTRRSPFSFRIDRFSSGKWRSVYNGDRAIRVGGFHVRADVDISSEPAEKYRLVCTSPKGSGILIDDVQLIRATPMQVVSVTTAQQTSPVLVRNRYNPVLEVRITTRGALAPLSITELQITTTGSDDLGDIESIEVISTGSQSRIDWRDAESWAPKSPKLGAAMKPAAGLTFRGNIPLQPGSNSLWVSMKLKDRADIDNFVDAGCKTVTISSKGKSKTHRPSVASPPGRQRLGTAVRKAGDDGVRAYRIPGLVTTNNGVLAAVYDVRYRGWGDLPGDIDVGMSRSTDGGKTWEKMKVIMDMGDDAKHRYDGVGDPSIVVDTVTNTIWVAATWSHGDRSWRGSGPGLSAEKTGQFMLVKSVDDGKTWSKPINITGQIKDPKWCFVLAGPGRGTTMADGTIVLPAQYQDPPDKKRLPHSTFIYSQDRGKTWRIGTGAFDDTTEAAVVELKPGVLMLNCRYNRKNRRVVTTTKDLGKTWIEHPTSRKTLIEPRACMASLLACPARSGSDKRWLLFSNPNVSSGPRRHMTIKLSTDSGLTWPEKHHLLLDANSSAGYSCLTMIDKKTIGILYEGGTAHMVFQRIPLADLLGGAEQ
ncbi:MAG: exo-alpha-sialidase [Phycisphaerae bacterium]|jgi:sialidase-1|nr:exo-alpha-sialidase [Phycisphaerae bacterium]